MMLFLLYSSDSTGDTSDSTTDITLTIDRKQILKVLLVLYHLNHY